MSPEKSNVKKVPSSLNFVCPSENEHNFYKNEQNKKKL